MHLNQNIDLVFGGAVETVSAVKEITYFPSLDYKNSQILQVGGFIPYVDSPLSSRLNLSAAQEVSYQSELSGLLRICGCFLRSLA